MSTRIDLILQDAAISRQISLLRFTAGEQKKVLAILTKLQKDLRLKLLGDLTDFGKARINKLLRETTAIIDAAYGKISTTGASEVVDILDVSAKEFLESLGKSKYIEFLTPYTSEQLKGSIIKKVSGINSGYVVKPDGDIVNVFNNSRHKGLGVVNIIDAIGNGGTKLDCMDGYLVKLYKSLGFVEYDRIAFDPKYAPKNWNYEKFGRPDVVFLKHEGSKDANIIKRNYEATWNQKLDADPTTAKVLEGIYGRAAGKTPGVVVGGKPGPVKAGIGTGVQGTLSTDMLGLARQEAQATAGSFIKIGLDASLPTEAALKALVNGSLIEGAPSSAWWVKQSDDLSFKFAAQVRQGIAANETVQQIVRRITGSPRLGTVGIMETSRRGAAALVHTSIQQVANDSRLATFKANDDIVKGVMQLSTLDGHTTKICIAYSGQSWDLEGNPIDGSTLAFNGGTPRHWNCRSILTAITKTYKELGLDIPEVPKGTRASDLGQIPSDTTFKSFLKRHDTAYQDNLLGPGRAKLWRNGKITLSQLVDGQGRELTLKQLNAL